MNRVEYRITEWFGRYKAQILVDGYGVEKAYFATRAEAEQWAAGKVDDLLEVVRYK